MNELEYEWCKEHHLKLFGNVSITREEKKTMFDIYNRIAKDNKTNLTCGSCVRSVLERLRGFYQAYESTMDQPLD